MALFIIDFYFWLLTFCLYLTLLFIWFMLNEKKNSKMHYCSYKNWKRKTSQELIHCKKWPCVKLNQSSQTSVVWEKVEISYAFSFEWEIWCSLHVDIWQFYCNITFQLPSCRLLWPHCTDVNVCHVHVISL